MRRSTAVGFVRFVRWSSSCVQPTLTDDIDKFAQFQPTTLSLQNFIDFGTENTMAKNSFTFLRKEVPVRLANIMKEIRLLPDQLLSQPSVKIVEGWYEQSFNDILHFEKANPDCPQTMQKFNETLDMIRNRHETVVETMAHGVLEMKEHASGIDNAHTENCIQYFLDRFYMSRIGIRMLIHQHLLLFTKLHKVRKHVGAIDPDCNVLSIAQDAYENARFLCEQYYMNAPDCIFECRNPFETAARTDDVKIIMPYVPSHLYHMLFELMKNAMRAVVEHHTTDNKLPKIKVLICKGRKDVTLKLSDQGGGIRRSELDLLFNYMYSTAPRPPSPDAAETTPLAGYGYGLPLSRLYAKYFNGDLWLNSVDGYGTDAMICLKLFPRDASELLPIYNKTSLNRYTQSTQVGDWSDGSHKIRNNGGGHQLFSH